MPCARTFLYSCPKFSCRFIVNCLLQTDEYHRFMRCQTSQTREKTIGIWWCRAFKPLSEVCKQDIINSSLVVILEQPKQLGKVNGTSVSVVSSEQSCTVTEVKREWFHGAWRCTKKLLSKAIRNVRRSRGRQSLRYQSGEHSSCSRLGDVTPRFGVQCLSRDTLTCG